MLFRALAGMFSRRPWPFLRFRTNDVLLGTSGVGVCILWCLIPPVVSIFIYLFIYFYFIFMLHRPPVRRSPSLPCTRSALLPEIPPQAEGRRFETCFLTLIFFHLGGLNFA